VRCLLDVSRDAGDEGPQLTLVESVRCLGCGALYAKPAGGGTVRENPGCPECGYVGWMGTALEPLNEGWTPARYAAGHQPRQSG